MPDRKFGFETLALHAGQIPDAATGSRAAPIYQTTSFVFDSAEHAASLFNLQTFGNVYSRISNPTVAVLEERVAALEGGRAALATASGQAAEAVALMTLLESGRSHVSAATLYGGTYTLLGVNLKKLGIDATFVDPDDPQNFRHAITTEHEARSTPKRSAIRRSTCVDIEPIAKIAHEAGIPFMVDNTVASPYLCRPIECGADIVVHSATKYIGGHGTTMGGVIVESGKFPWDNGKFPGMTEPSQRLSRRELLRNVRRFRLHDERADGDDAHLRAGARRRSTRGCSCRELETLPLRMERHCANALGVARVPRRASAGVVGELSGSAGQQVLRRSRASTCPRARAACCRSASREAAAPA